MIWDGIEETTWLTVMKIVKWISIPVLLLASLFVWYAGSYEPLVDAAVWLSAVILIRRAIQLQEIHWATLFVAVPIVFTPLSIVDKIFLLAALAVLAAVAHIYSAWKTKPSPAVRSVILMLVLTMAIPIAGMSQTASAEGEPLDWQGKLEFHAKSTYEPVALASIAAYAGFLQEIDSPTEWGQGGGAYAKRFASTLGWSAIHTTLAFTLDTTLHQDPRYYRSLSTGFWRRSAHALRGTLLTRTDAGGETISTWRIGSAYGAAFLSNTWYPARLDTVRYGILDGSVSLGLGFVANLGAEFWPDLKSRLRRK